MSVVSTHSRPKAAAILDVLLRLEKEGFNTQPPEGGCAVSRPDWLFVNVSTHSRPKAAARRLKRHLNNKAVSTHSRPKAAAWSQT